MIQITPQMRILLAVEPVDFRNGIDGLAGLCRQRLESDPLTGAVFVFSSRSRKSVKILCYDGYRTLEIMGRQASRFGGLLW
jgi:transposase